MSAPEEGDAEATPEGASSPPATPAGDRPEGSPPAPTVEQEDPAPAGAEAAAPPPADSAVEALPAPVAAAEPHPHPVAEPAAEPAPAGAPPAPEPPVAQHPAEELPAEQPPDVREAEPRWAWEDVVAASLSAAERPESPAPPEDPADRPAVQDEPAAQQQPAPGQPAPWDIPPPAAPQTIGTPLAGRPRPGLQAPPPAPRHRAPDTGAAPAVSAPRPAPAPPRPTPEPARPRPAAATATVEPDTAGHGATASGGGAVVTASYGRFRRRIVLAVLALVVLVAAGVTGVVVLRSSGGTTASAELQPQLPTVGEPAPALAALASTAPAPDADKLRAELTPLLTAPALGQGVGAEVVDVAGGKVLLDQDAATPATPASTAKLLTSVAALTTLDPESTLTTTVVAGATPGEVVLVGGGDPTLSRQAQSANYPGAASLVDLANQVKAALGGAQVTRVVVDGSLYSGPLTASGWQSGDAPSSYASPVTAVSVDGGRTSATSTNRSGTPATDAGQALAAALGVPRAQVVQGTAPPGARTLGAVHSAPISRIVEQALSQSDNMLAEALSRQVAIARKLPASFEGSAQGVIAALKDDGIDVSGVTLSDGSGLSRDDRVPPRVLADLITRAADGKPAGTSAILSGLSVAGYDGTLSDRGDDDPKTAPGAVRGKTGTLLGVHALAGTVVTADGRLLAFAIVADSSTGSDTAAESALDDVATALAGCGCR